MSPPEVKWQSISYLKPLNYISLFGFTKLPSAVVVTRRSIFGNEEVSQLESNASCGRANLTYLSMGLDQEQKSKHYANLAAS